jgi:K+-sensing histidine kinase KdpD
LNGGVERGEHLDWAAPGYAIGGIGAIAVAAAMVPLRDHVQSANLALVLVLVVVLAAAVGGRAAGAIGAVVAALSFDFFLTQPYMSLKIESANDFETTVILLAIGLVVGEIVVRARRDRRAAVRGADEIARLHRVAEQAASGAPLPALVRTLEAELTDLLGLRDCWFEPVGDAASGASFARPLPRLERNGAVAGAHERSFVDGSFTLPSELELPVMGRGQQLGRFVLVADAREGASIEARTVAIALSDQLGGALALGAVCPPLSDEA